MEENREIAEKVRQNDEERNEAYLGKIFTMLKKMEGVALTKARSHFNNSEMRLLGEILLADYSGKRIISTQLATRLGITRSAVSQMVNKLESRGIVKRVPDDKDRKIAYIELSDTARAQYEDMKGRVNAILSSVIGELGDEKVETFVKSAHEFVDAFDGAVARQTAGRA